LWRPDGILLQSVCIKTDEFGCIGICIFCGTAILAVIGELQARAALFGID